MKLLAQTNTTFSPEESLAQFQTNVFGLLNVTRAFLPHLRSQRSGVIANISSVGAWRGFPGFGLYVSSKWAVSALSESMTAELADFGIKVTSIEPGYFRSKFLNPGNRLLPTGHIADYDGTAARAIGDMMDQYDNNQPGDLKKGAKVIVDVLKQKDGREIPMRLVLGSDAYDLVNKKCEETMSLLKEWEDVTKSTNYD